LACHTANHRLASNGKPQSVNNVFWQQSNGAVTERLQRFGGQDKTALRAVRVASRQPEPLHKAARLRGVNNKPDRTKKHGSTKRQTIHLVLWVNPIVKAALCAVPHTRALHVSQTSLSSNQQLLKLKRLTLRIGKIKRG
jgi:hypothetical protein